MDAFISKIRPLAAPYEEERIAAAHTIWSFLLAPQHPRIPSTQIHFFAGVIASQWQMCQNAVALSDIPELSASLLQGPLDQMGPNGQLPDMYDEVTFESQCTKPPMHGWALKQIMARRDLIADVGRDKIETLYAGLCKWADFWQTIRDDDGDGLPVVYHPDEVGIDDCSLFVNHNQLVTPDVCAYLTLRLEANGDLAKALEKPELESAVWYQKSAE